MKKMLQFYDKLKESIAFRDGLPYWVNHKYKKHNGKVAGCINNGYRRIKVTINGIAMRVQAHRLHWYIIHDQIESMLDHIDQDKDNNRIENLRRCTQSQNSRNVQPRGRSKYMGVHLDKRGGKWISQASISRKKYHIGSFETELQAAHAYDQFCLNQNLTHANLNFKEELS